LHGDPDHVVEWLLRGERRAARLRVKAQPGALVRSAELLAHDAGPEATRGAKLGDLLEEVVMGGEEEGEARREALQVESRRQCASHVFEGIREGDCDFLRRRRAGFADVVARDRDGVPARELVVAEREYVRDQPQAGLNG